MSETTPRPETDRRAPGRDPSLEAGPAAAPERLVRVPDEVAPLDSTGPSRATARTFASALRAAGLRAALLASLYVLVWLLFLGSGSAIFRDVPPASIWFAGIFTAAVLGLVAAPLAFVESFFAARCRTRSQEVLVGGLVWALAVGGFALATVQVVYTFAMLRSGSFEKGAAEVGTLCREAMSGPWLLALLGFPAAPFLPTTVGRLRGQPLGEVVRRSLVQGPLLAAPCAGILWLGAGTNASVDPSKLIVPALLAGFELAGCALLPVVLHGADALERRLAAWLSRRELRP